MSPKDVTITVVYSDRYKSLRTTVLVALPPGCHERAYPVATSNEGSDHRCDVLSHMVTLRVASGARVYTLTSTSAGRDWAPLLCERHPDAVTASLPIGWMTGMAPRTEPWHPITLRHREPHVARGWVLQRWDGVTLRDEARAVDRLAFVLGHLSYLDGERVWHRAATVAAAPDAANAPLSAHERKLKAAARPLRAELKAAPPERVTAAHGALEVEAVRRAAATARARAERAALACPSTCEVCA
jgi:hypothetical protein